MSTILSLFYAQYCPKVFVDSAQKNRKVATLYTLKTPVFMRLLAIEKEIPYGWLRRGTGPCFNSDEDCDR